MFDRYDAPWIEFKNVEHATEPTYVRADTVLAIEKGPSGVTVHLFGGAAVRVGGTVKAIKAQIDAFWIEWHAGEHKRRDALNDLIAKAEAQEPKP